MSDQFDNKIDQLLSEIMELERKYSASDRNISTQRQSEINSIIKKYSVDDVIKDEAWYSWIT